MPTGTRGPATLVLFCLAALCACGQAGEGKSPSASLPDGSLIFDSSAAMDAAQWAADSGDMTVADALDVLAADGGGAALDSGGAAPAKICVPGLSRCEGLLLATCAPAGDGWSLSPCFAGQACQEHQCRTLANNLVIVFDTSGSMATKVSGESCPAQQFPACDPAKGCSRMDASKLVFAAVLEKIPLATTNMAMFRFPQRVGKSQATSCDAGHYLGTDKLVGDTADLQHVAADSKWYWDFIDQILCVAFPRNSAEALGRKPLIEKWLDGAETLVKTAISCANSSATCLADAKCGAGACCAQKCWQHKTSPELRASGGTPIGKTLFYVGEYLRHRVVVDGRACIVATDCLNPNYTCVKGYCVDPARECRQNVVVLFTDGGENNDASQFFAPQSSAIRMAWGLACKGNADCVGGASCVLGRCRPPNSTGYACLGTGAPCKSGDKDPNSPTFCPAVAGQSLSCLPEPTKSNTAAAIKFADNVLRSPDGKPFAVRLHVVDISGAASLSKSFYLSVAGNGRLLTADAADPTQFFAALESAFDMKDKNICGTHP